MPLYVLYHNSDVEQLVMSEKMPRHRARNPFDYGIGRVFTTKQDVLFNAVNARAWCFFIVGIGRPRKYYLWAYLQFRSREDEMTGVCEGWTLNPPQILTGAEFEEFKERDCGRFGFGLQNVSDSAYALKLVEVVQEFHKPRITRKTLRFFSEFVELAGDNDNLEYYAREMLRLVKRALGRKSASSAKKGKKSPTTTKKAGPKGPNKNTNGTPPQVGKSRKVIKKASKKSEPRAAAKKTKRRG